MSYATGLIADIEKTMIRTDLPEVGPGDTVRVHFRIREGEKERLQVFEGTVIGLQNSGSRKSVVVRKMSHGVGVERIFPLSSPSVAKIEKVSSGRVRRAKLYFLRNLRGKAASLDNKL